MGFLCEPMRVSLSLTISRTRLACLPDQGAEIGHLPARNLTHHLAHLLELLDESLDRLHVGARSARDPQPAGAIEQLGVPALLGSHRQDDRLETIELAFIDLHSLELLAESGEHPQQRLQRPETANLSQLLEEVIEAEFLL